MDKTKLANLASDLILRQIHSDLKISIQTVTHENGDFGIILGHRDDRYEYGSEHLAFYTFHNDAEIIRTFEHMKDVIAGERLITDEKVK